MKLPAPDAPPAAEPVPAPETSAEALRRARFQNLIWREQKAKATHVIRRTSAGPNAPQADVPAEWLRELDHR